VDAAAAAMVGDLALVTPHPDNVTEYSDYYEQWREQYLVMMGLEGD
jgi:hypothetical protein